MNEQQRYGLQVSGLHLTARSHIHRIRFYGGRCGEHLETPLRLTLSVGMRNAIIFNYKEEATVVPISSNRFGPQESF